MRLINSEIGSPEFLNIYGYDPCKNAWTIESNSRRTLEKSLSLTQVHWNGKEFAIHSPNVGLPTLPPLGYRWKDGAWQKIDESVFPFGMMLVNDAEGQLLDLTKNSFEPADLSNFSQLSRKFADRSDRFSGITQMASLSKILVWGGISQGSGRDRDTIFGDGKTYDLSKGAWVATPKDKAPSPRFQSLGIPLDGDRVMVWGGAKKQQDDGRVALADVLTDGAIFDGTTNTWKAIAEAPDFSRDMSANTSGDADRFAGYWTGKYVVIFDTFSMGTSPSANFPGWIYDLEKDLWAKIAVHNDGKMIDSPKFFVTAKGRVLIANSFMDAGFVFDPAKNSWRKVDFGNVPVQGRLGTGSTGTSRLTWVFTGKSFVLWGSISDKACKNKPMNQCEFLRSANENIGAVFTLVDE